jgi:hypothetical protein
MLPTSILGRQASALVPLMASVLSTQVCAPSFTEDGKSRQGPDCTLDTRLPVALADVRRFACLGIPRRHYGCV